MNVIEKLDKILDLYEQIDDELFKKFFDLDSTEMIDQKLDVMEKLIQGKKPSEIKDYYEVLELYPSDSKEHWD